jgi:hypothetical protein
MEGEEKISNVWCSMECSNAWQLMKGEEKTSNV